MILQRENSLVLGESFGKYQVLRKLGGGMADVYLAYHPDFNRQVVLKIIERSQSESASLAIEAEKRGAELQSKLHSRDRRILEIYETGELNGCFFLSMQYFPGRNLAEILSVEQKIDPHRAARLAAAVCSQLRTLHGFLSSPEQKTSVVHGDIKPSNIQIGAHDELRLLDFGIAKLIRAGHNLTHHQLGSPGYCSPERLRNYHVDVHSDLWALAVTFYEMVTGVPPFRAADTRQLERLIQSRNLPLILPEACPPVLKSILSKGLAADPDKRYRSAAELEADLEHFIAGRPVESASAPRASGSGETTVLRTHQPKPSSASKLARETSPKPPQLKSSQHDRANLTIALLAGLLAGVLLLIPATFYLQARRVASALSAPKDYVQSDASALAADWKLFKTYDDPHTPAHRFFDRTSVARAFSNNLLSSAGNLIVRTRSASTDSLDRGAWLRAKRCLLDALTLRPEDRTSTGELHLASGYLALAESTAPASLLASFHEFSRAAAFLPRSPDPRLGLARLYFSEWHNLGAGLAQLHQAQQFGYQLGPREMKEEADCYLFRAERNLHNAAQFSDSSATQPVNLKRLAHADLERARAIYEPIAGFDGVDAALEKVGADLNQESPWSELQAGLSSAANRFAALLKSHFQKKSSWSHRH